MKKFEFFLLLGLLCLCPKLSAQHMPTRVFPTPQEIEVTNQPFISADFRITGAYSGRYPFTDSGDIRSLRL